MKNSLQRRRRELGLTQHELALAANVPRYVVCLAENAVRCPSPEHQAALAETLGVKISELFAEPKTFEPKAAGSTATHEA